MLDEELGDGADPIWRAEVQRALDRHADMGPEVLSHGVAIVHARIRARGPPIQRLVRLREPMVLTDDDGEPLRFLWILLSGETTHPHMNVAAEFAALMEDPVFREAACTAEDEATLSAAYDQSLDEEVHFAHHIPEELRPTGKILGGLRADMARRLPHYLSDYIDGLQSKSIATTLFLFFACFAPTVAFGGLLGVLTNGEMGAVETIVGTTICGITYALLSGQPLTIIGSTGPIVIFLGMLYGVTSSLGLAFMPAMAWVGIWTSLFCLILAATGTCAWLRFFTRFTDETFAALISVIFIVEALTDIGGAFTDDAVSHDTALLSLVLALGTYMLATALSRFRRSIYLLRSVREFFADFGPTIAIAAFTCIAFVLHEVDLPTLAVPETVAPSGGRGWFVNPLDAPTWWWAASIIPAIVGTILVYLDQNITVRLVNKPENKLKKGAGYHQDLAVVAVLIGVCSIIGLPWCVAATVRSLNHVRALAKVEEVDQEGNVAAHERTTGVIETRVTGLAVHVLIGASLLLLPLLSQVPMSVLFGLFLFMGVASLRGNQFWERLQLMVTDPRMYPPSYFIRAVPKLQIHKYTAIQAVSLAVLWIVKAGPAGILFPLFIALLVPVRMGMSWLFKPEHLALLDSGDVPDEGLPG